MRPRVADRTQSGFTLYELIIITAIIGAIAAIALPNFMQSRKAANESAAIGDLRTLIQAQELFRTRDPLTSYATSFAALGAQGVVDSSLGSGTKGGYLFNMVLADQYKWAVQANPIVPGATGDRYFWIDESGVIRFTIGATASSTSFPVGG